MGNGEWGPEKKRRREGPRVLFCSLVVGLFLVRAGRSTML